MTEQTTTSFRNASPDQLPADRKDEIRKLLRDIQHGLKNPNEAEYFKSLIISGNLDYLSDITSITCPFCSMGVPVEVGINIPSLNEYISFAGVQHGGYGPDRSYPFFVVELDTDVRGLRESIDRVVEEQERRDRAIRQIREQCGEQEAGKEA